MRGGKFDRIKRYMARNPGAHRDTIAKDIWISRNAVTALLHIVGYEQIGTSGFYKKCPEPTIDEDEING